MKKKLLHAAGRATRVFPPACHYSPPPGRDHHKWPNSSIIATTGVAAPRRERQDSPWTMHIISQWYIPIYCSRIVHHIKLSSISSNREQHIQSQHFEATCNHQALDNTAQPFTCPLARWAPLGRDIVFRDFLKLKSSVWNLLQQEEHWINRSICIFSKASCLSESVAMLELMVVDHDSRIIPYKFALKFMINM